MTNLLFLIIVSVSFYSSRAWLFHRETATDTQHSPRNRGLDPKDHPIHESTIQPPSTSGDKPSPYKRQLRAKKPKPKRRQTKMHEKVPHVLYNKIAITNPDPDEVVMERNIPNPLTITWEPYEIDSPYSVWYNVSVENEGIALQYALTDEPNYKYEITGYGCHIITVYAYIKGKEDTPTKPVAEGRSYFVLIDEKTKRLNLKWAGNITHDGSVELAYVDKSRIVQGDYNMKMPMHSYYNVTKTAPFPEKKRILFWSYLLVISSKGNIVQEGKRSFARTKRLELWKLDVNDVVVTFWGMDKKTRKIKLLAYAVDSVFIVMKKRLTRKDNWKWLSAGMPYHFGKGMVAGYAGMVIVVVAFMSGHLWPPALNLG